ncbi:Translation elongation factor Ts [hydrothermal vent metagenome]|uniref:Translation elongation factor Ts n=1 Tax=hydrothermal vent metagenome TaxID=652676 RepID=A0A3B0Z161_9ZZZZ
MAITAALVKELRDRTGAGMMECKKALTVTDGDIDIAIENMRKAGAAKADKKSGRITAEGKVSYAISADDKKAAMVEVNCETDFAASNEDLIEFVDTACQLVLEHSPKDVEALNALTLADGSTVNTMREALIGKIGENIQVRRFEQVTAEGSFAVYQHGVKIAVLVDYSGGDSALGKDIAMHVAASRPLCISEDQVPQVSRDKEKEIFTAQARESGKPDNIIEKMIDGRMRKYLAEITLLGQAFIKEPDMSVSKLLDSKKASVHSFICYEVGEGIEKKVENFADEVSAQMKD